MLKKRIDSFKYAINGVKILFKSEIHAKFHLTTAIIVLFLAYIFEVSSFEWMILIATISAVIAAEAFNTSLEQLTNLVSPSQHPIAGKVKDLAAAGVLIIAIGAALIGLFIFLPKIFLLF